MSSAPIDFAVLFREHYPRVYRYVRYRVSDDTLAEDLTAEAFERAYRSRASYDPARGAFSTWIGRIAHNHVSNYLSSQGRRAGFEVDMTDIAQFESIAVAEAHPEAQIIAREGLQRLRECLERLTDRDREVIALRFGGETRNKDIAELLGLNAHSVSVIILRALERLRGCQEAA